MNSNKNNTIEQGHKNVYQLVKENSEKFKAGEKSAKLHSPIFS